MLRFFVALQILVTERVESRADEGATAVEYGLMVALIAAVIVVAVTALGSNVNAKFLSTCQAIKGSSCAP